MSNYHGCKGEAINLIPHYVIYRYYLQNCKSIIFRKVINHTKHKLLMFQVIFVFSDQNPAWSFELGTRDWVKMHRFNAFYVNTINCKIFPTYGGIYKLENSASILQRDKILQSLKKIWKDVSLKLILKNKGGKQHCLPFCWF